ncbi:MAG TPA: OB-fold nucleic acid binding domain-containing protein [Candidatus Nanoarchaeia archaeon]|nr:OB-fold nucleic acid binding domain-containing protein [Candidatus Nanoarchaeia archaeon]
MENIKRQTAFKLWIGNIISSRYTKGSEQFEADYIEFDNKKISRVNLIGSVIDKSDGNNYVSFILDDSSGSIRLKSWNEEASSFSNVQIGDLVLVVGKIKEYNNQVYITPEIIKKLDNPLWLRVRKLELINLYGEPTRVESTSVENIGEDEDVVGVVEEKVTNDIPASTREKIISLIEGLDRGEGVPLSDVVIGSGLAENEVTSIVEDMIKDGEIFEIQKNKLRVVG